MKKIMMAFMVIVVLIVAGCATSSNDAQKSDDTRGSEASPGTTAVTEIVQKAYILKDTSYFNDGYVESYIVYTYDDLMSIVREDMFDSFDGIIESNVYENISQGVIKKSLYDGRGLLQSWKKIVNNTDGQVLNIETYNSEDQLQTVSEYTWDSNGNKISWKVFDPDGVALSETKYIYESGMNTRIEIYDASMKLREYFDKKYKDALLIRTSHYDENDKLKAAIEYEYNDGFLVQEKYLRANGSTSRTVKYTNDLEGSAVKVEFFDGNGKLKDWNEKEYEYISEEMTVWK